ncbi:MAG: glutamate formimidoyltransferase [Thermoflexales bacterium]|nr:glutamate formimidoyltransferase [Thermoflexales bacterium]
MKTLVECVPNFSEGRRKEVIDAILAEITAVRGVALLDAHSDPDHNRTVVTYVGEAAPVEEAAFRAIKKAAELIDMDEHRGEHPRLGATDVLPFVPIAGVTMAECAQMARRLGRRVGDELGIPVYLYAEATQRPGRESLAAIRRGQYEALKAEIETDPAREPDFGPRQLGTAGAVVIGARSPLVAYNIYLNTPDAAIAQKVADVVRFSKGGFRHVMAKGLLVGGQAQVSMNLTDFRSTSMALVHEAVRREAARHGASITHSEIVGLVPQAALTGAAAHYLQVKDFDSDQILENRLGGVDPGGVDPGAFLDAVAAGSPTPGGGAVSALAGALAAALTAMVARLTAAKPKYADVHPQMQEALARVEALRGQLTRAIEQDNAAFDRVMEAYRLPRRSAEEKAARFVAVQLATMGAARVPLETMHLAVQALEAALVVAELGNPSSMTDVGVAAHLARAAALGAALNVRVNLAALEGREHLGSLSEQVETLCARAAELAGRVVEVVEKRAGLL